MNITVSTRLESISESTKKYALEKAKKLEKFYKLRRIEVIMDSEGEKYKVEIVVSPEKGSPIVAVSIESEWLAAIDHTSDKVERQLRKLKGKVKSHRMKKFVPEKEDKTEPVKQEKEEQTYEEIVDEMRNK